MVRDCPMIVSSGKKGKQVPPTVPHDDVPKKITFMHSGLEDQSRTMKMMLVSYSIFILVFMSFF